ncbi:MAG: DNA repair protein RecN [Firmicutes bacterium]|nr:DNA repair protein RecN [Bacillota bacterium]
MIRILQIKNVALIENAEIEFGEGFNVLTGETGAGKSIVLGALNFILGEKLGKHMIRTGETSAKVTAVFDQGIFTRVLKSDGKSECRIDGEIVSVAEFKTATASLVDIHGQHDTAKLLDPRNHLEVIDQFGEIDMTEYHDCLLTFKDLEKKLKSFGTDESERARLVDLYEYQIKEIERVGFKDGEEEELTETRARMMNFEKIVGNLTQALESLQYKRTISSLSTVAQFDQELGKLYEEAEGLGYSLQAIEESISSYLSTSEYDEREFQRVDARLDEIKSLKRKYGDVQSFYEKTKAEHDRLINSEREISALKSAIDKQKKLLETSADKLTRIRREIASKLEVKLLERLRPLGMPAAEFKCEVKSVDEGQFMFSANVGEPLKSLSAVISGGELSRFMLALKSLVSSQTATLVFDEIDTGIGGDIGRKVGDRLKELSAVSQVIAVTHLPQIAVLADQHFQIIKQTNNSRTNTIITPLDDTARAAELARMTG